MRFIFLLAAAPLVLTACGSETEELEAGDPEDIEIGGETVNRPSPTENPTYVEEEEAGDGAFTPGSWSTDDVRAVYGARTGEALVNVRCEEDENDLVVTRSIEVGDGDRVPMIIIAGDERVEGYWQGMGEVVGRAMTRIPVSNAIVDAMTTADRIVFRAEGFDDVITPNDGILEVVTRRCTVAR